MVSATGAERGGPEPAFGPSPDPFVSAPAVVPLPAGVEERRELAVDPKCPPETLAVLGVDPDPDVRMQVAWNPSTPAATLEWLADNNEADTVGLNLAAPPELLTRIVDKYEYARDAVASNPAAPAELLTSLSDSYPDYVALNPNTPPETLARLAELEPAVPVLAAELDETITPAEYAISIRHLVASHESCPPETLERLAGDTNDEVRMHVALNPAASPETLVRLAGDQEAVVRASAAANPSCPPETMERLAGDGRAVVRAHVAINPAAPVATLERLAGDSNADVRMQVALNPNTPAWIRDALT